MFPRLSGIARRAEKRPLKTSLQSYSLSLWSENGRPEIARDCGSERKAGPDPTVSREPLAIEHLNIHCAGRRTD